MTKTEYTGIDAIKERLTELYIESDKEWLTDLKALEEEVQHDIDFMIDYCKEDFTNIYTEILDKKNIDVYIFDDVLTDDYIEYMIQKNQAEIEFEYRYQYRLYHEL